MGTPEFAVASLKALVENGLPPVAVITAPDKPAGRGMKLTGSAVKNYAQENGLKILQPPKLKDPGFIEELKALNPHLGAVVAFRMLPEIVWNLPQMGTINLHGSLLPQYRGAAPINWAIINGETETGVTTFKLQHEIDTGDILLKELISIGADETAGQLHDRMKEIGAQLLVKTVRGILTQTIREQPQSAEENLKTAPKIFTENCRIDFNQSTQKVYNLVRGLSPFPGAFTFLNGKTLKILAGSIEKGGSAKNPGEYITDGRSYLKFACADGYLSLRELQLEGKKKMEVGDFLRGYRFTEGASN